MSHDGSYSAPNLRDSVKPVAEDADGILDTVHRDCVHRGPHNPEDMQVSGPTPQVDDNLVGQVTIARDQTSILQSATDFDIHGGNFSTVAGDFFTASRDLHVTIHNHTGPLTRDNERQENLLYHEGQQASSESSLPPLPIQRSCDIYRRHLASKGRGIPLWIPEPNKNLPIEYQRKGIAIGDVGILTASGSFAFLFNICLPPDHPINPPNLPQNFRPINVAPFNIHSQSEFKHNSYLASASTVRSQNEGDSTGLIFESSAHDGAILTMPVGSKSEDLGSTGRFRKYVAANMLNWYKYAYHDREYDVKNGDLRLVIGHDKTSFWGMATFSNSSAQQEIFQLKFGLIDGRRKYGWQYFGMAEVRAGPDSQEIVQLRDNDPTQEGFDYENQCLFVRTMNATLPDKVWEELGFDVEDLAIDVGSDSSADPAQNYPQHGDVSKGKTNSDSLTTSKAAGTNMNTWGNQPVNAVTVYASESGSVSSLPLTFGDHPSKAVNAMLLENCTEQVKVAITQDQDWMSVLGENDHVLPPISEILERVKASYVICEEEGIIFLSKIQEQLKSNTPTASSVNVSQDSETYIKESTLSTLENVPVFNAGVAVLSSTYRDIERVKLYKAKCKDISNRCINLITSITDSPHELDSNLFDVSDEFEIIAIHISRTFKEWASWNRLKSFLRQGEIRDGIERLNKDIEAAAMKFNVRGEFSAKVNRKQVTVAQERDKAEVREALQAIIKSSDDMKLLLSMDDPRPVTEVMESLQTELMQSSSLLGESEDYKEDFKAGLWTLHEQTSKLPPLTDLTGQVTTDTGTTETLGSSAPIFKGCWLGHKTVALRLVISLSNQQVLHDFQKELTTWRGVNHPNVLPLYGFAHINPATYTVSAWTEEGSIIAYMQKFPDIDRLKILTDVVAGLDYLHSGGIIHGDIRGTNVLISVNGVACLSNFGASKFLEENHETGMPPNATNARWTAPEILQQSADISSYSDVWSYGMLCLEILSGSKPYSDIQLDISAIREIRNGYIPQRPVEPDSRALSDEMWTLLKKCWKKNPASRPSVSNIKAQLLDLQGPGFSIDNVDRIATPILQETQVGQTTQTSAARSSISNTSRNISSWEIETSSSALPRPIAGTSKLTSFDSLISLRMKSPKNNHLQKSHSGVEDDTLLEPLSDTRPTVLISDGVVLAGTLEGLVQHLVTCNFNSRKENDYVAVFLTVFPDFATPEKLFSVLSRCFHEAERNNDMHPEDRVKWQYNIFTVLMCWLSDVNVKVDSHLLVGIRYFCEEAFRIKSSTTMTNKAKELLEVVFAREKQEYLVPPILVLPDKTKLKSSQVTPQDIAIALTLLEGDKYKVLTPLDYLAHLRRHPGRNNVEGVYTTNNSVMLWVKDALLHYGGVSERASVLKFFINTAMECQKMRNFSSMVAIATALHSDPIERLRLTKAELSPQMHTKLATLKGILDVSANHRSYRESLEDTTNTQGKDNCVPWLAIHLKEMHLVLQRYPVVVNAKGQPLINFERYYKFIDRIKEVVHYMPPDLEQYRQTGLLEYIENQLFKLELSKVTEEDLVARSKKFEAQETMAYRSRKSQLRSLGFTLLNRDRT